MATELNSSTTLTNNRNDNNANDDGIDGNVDNRKNFNCNDCNDFNDDDSDDSDDIDGSRTDVHLLQHQFGDSDQKFLIKYPQLIFILTEPKAEHATDIFPADKNLAELLAPNGTKTDLGPISLRSKLQQLDTSAALSLKMPLLRFKEKVLTSIVD